MKKSIKNHEDFIKEIKSKKKIISGEFDFFDDEDLMDLDFENKHFKRCNLIGGDFACGIFRNCIFENVIFYKTDLPCVSFIKCIFKNCNFLNVTNHGFGFNDCDTKKMGFINYDENSVHSILENNLCKLTKLEQIESKIESKNCMLEILRKLKNGEIEDCFKK